MPFQSVTPEGAHTAKTAYICFPSYKGSTGYLATKDHGEVCLLSHRVMSQPVSVPLQNGVRFLSDPLPGAPSAFLTVGLPIYLGRTTGLPCSA